MTFKVTVESTRRSLNYADLVCINDLCKSEDVTVTCTPGSTAELTKENYECRACRTFWIAEMHAARIETIHSPTGVVYGGHDYSDAVERGVFNQIAIAKGPIQDALSEFIAAMKMGSPNRKGEALAKLAFMARVEL